MKRIFVYFFVFVFLFFLLPAFLTKRDINTSINNEDDISNQESIVDNSKDNQEEKEYDYSKYGIIKLLHKKTGEVEDVKIDDYICNVVSAEMPADFEIEALKAQAVVARTYTIYKIQNKKHDNADICDDSTCCQAWISKENRLARWEESKRESNWQKIEQCVKETRRRNYNL